MRLTTGKEFSVGGAGDEMLGIGADLEVREGYDEGNIQWDGRYDDDDEPDNPDWLTKPEKIEVCDIMIKRWSDLRQRLVTENSTSS